MTVLPCGTLSAVSRVPPPPLRTAVVVNPSKVTDMDALRGALCGRLTEAGWPDPIWLETTPEDPGRGQALEAIEQGAEVVFACGGDGTVMAVVTALAGTGVAMAVLPAGTGNLLATNLGLAGEPAAAVEVVLDGGRRDLDVGVVGDQCFAVMAGMGFDAQMLDATSDTAKKHIGWIAYVGGAVKHLRDRPMRIRLTLDDGPVLHRRARSVLVGNVGRLQGGVKLLADAEPDDGLLDVAVLTPRTLRHWAQLGWAVVRRHERVPRLETHTARTIRILSNRPQPRQLDGDLIDPGAELAVTIRERALVLCVPQPEQSPDLATGAEEAAERAT